MSRRPNSPLTEKQLAAVKILLGRRDMPLSEKSTKANPKAINRTTAWGLEEAGLVTTWWIDGGERVRLHSAVRQLVALGKEPA